LPDCSVCFAGLCAVFAACATLSDWHDQASRARWPIVAAVIERNHLVASARAPKYGGGTTWKLRCHVRYEWNGEALTATLASRVVFGSGRSCAAILGGAASQRQPCRRQG